MNRIGIDVGGTFTDFVVQSTTNGLFRYFKLPSTQDDPSRAILEGIRQLLDQFALAPDTVSYIGHGTTVATNMIIEGRGVPTGLLTTSGFRDVLAIGRQNRPSLYDTSVRKPQPLVDRFRRLEVRERTSASGKELVPLDEAQLRERIEELAATGVEAVAISFLHSYRNPAHEERAAALVEAAMPGVYVSVSSKVLPEC
ncbi:MAG: hypothetical protein ABS75_23720 [Pelagibacterium sp. SCN 63-23]|nr:MAG: hypothetical protein ABS75_23720 [Pelagibacterium sp. SCN 63-23]